MRRKNEGPCITFHLNPPRPANQKSRRVPAFSWGGLAYFLLSGQVFMPSIV